VPPATPVKNASRSEIGSADQLAQDGIGRGRSDDQRQYLVGIDVDRGERGAQLR
jgi:hypothetical protein